MNKYIYEGKSFEDAKIKALNGINVREEDCIIKLLEEKKGLLKKCVKIEVITYNDIINYLKESINKILSLMNISANLEVRKRDKNIEVNIFSDHNSILIGHNGKNLESLQNIIRQVMHNQIKDEYKITLDIENYREKRISKLERLAKSIAKEVKQTKVETKLDRMNSFERRVIHNALTNNKYVYTESVGEEPNRCVVIKPKEES